MHRSERDYYKSHYYRLIFFFSISYCTGSLIIVLLILISTVHYQHFPAPQKVSFLKGTLFLSNGTFILCLITYLGTCFQNFDFAHFFKTKCLQCSSPIILECDSIFWIVIPVLWNVIHAFLKCDTCFLKMRYRFLKCDTVFWNVISVFEK